QRRQGVVVGVDGLLGLVGGGALVGVAVALRLGDQVRAARAADAQPARPQPGGHRGDAQADVVLAGDDLVPGGAQFLGLGAAGGVGVPLVTGRQRLGVLVQRRLAPIALAAEVQHVIGVEHAPDRRERVAEAEVDAAHLAAGHGGFVVRDAGG